MATYDKLIDLERLQAFKDGCDSEYQQTLVSGTNIKTVNSQSLLGSGNIAISSDVTTWYGTCSTAGSERIKEVSCDGFTLKKGAVLLVYFDTQNTYTGDSSTALNVNSTGSKTITMGQVARSKNLVWAARTHVLFVYNGSEWVYLVSSTGASVRLVEGAGVYYGSCSTPAYDADKLSGGPQWSERVNGLVVISMTNGNTVTDQKLTLSVNSMGSKDIYARGSVTSSSNTLLWNAGDVLFFMWSSTYWNYLGGSTAYGYTLPTASTSTLGGVKVDGSTITIDGNGVISGSSSLSPYTGNPAMDGTASAGSSNDYARGDHVHPTDTSRVPVSSTSSGATTAISNIGSRVQMSYEQGRVYSDVRANAAGVSLSADDGTNISMLNVFPSSVYISGVQAPTTDAMPTTKKYVDDGLAAKQATLVSGTNIKTVGSQSLLGSGNLTVSDIGAAPTSHTHQYAGSPAAGGNANATNAILYGKVDSTSTSTVFTATIAGLTQLVDGTTIMLHNGVVTSAANFTVNINNLGAKKCYNNLTNATQDTTIFNIAYTMMFVYASDLDEGNGGWWIYRGYDANTNTIGYQVRTNSGNKTASDTGYRYRIWLTSADGSKWVPINTSTSTNGTSNRTLNTRAIDPFGPIVYRATNGTCTSGTGIGATGIWQQYTLNIGYSYMASGFSLTFPDSVYLKCTPQTDGSAKMESIVQALPSTKDGKIYIYLGTAYSATNMELEIFHPVYWHDDTGIRAWTGVEPGSGVDPATAAPSMDGTAAVGSSAKYAREDHVHPSDTSKVDKSNTASSGNISITSKIGYGNGEAEVTSRRSSDGINSSAKVSPISASLYSIDGDNEHYGSTVVRNDYVMLESYDSSGSVTQSSSITVAPSGVTINKLITPTTDTMPTTKKYVDDGLAAKQATLVSGTNIKTVNNTSLLGSGNIAIPALPSVTSSDNGKVLQVVNGAWAAASLPSANGVSF